MVGYPFQPYLAKSDKIDFNRLFQLRNSLLRFASNCDPEFARSDGRRRRQSRRLLGSQLGRTGARGERHL